VQNKEELRNAEQVNSVSFPGKIPQELKPTVHKHPKNNQGSSSNQYGFVKIKISSNPFNFLLQTGSACGRRGGCDLAWLFWGIWLLQARKMPSKRNRCKGCAKLVQKLHSVVRWLGFGMYWVRTCKIFPKYGSSICFHAQSRWWHRAMIFTDNTTLGKAARILEGRIRVRKRCWQPGKGSEKAAWNVIGIGAISYICDRITTCTNTGWVTNAKAVITQGIWSGDSESHLTWDIKGVNFQKNNQVLYK